MRTERDIHLMIDYLRARSRSHQEGAMEAMNPQHPDISILCWVLDENKPATPITGDAALLEANKDLSQMVIEQANEIETLKQKLGRFVTPPTRMGK